MTYWREVYRVAEARCCLVAEDSLDRTVVGCGALWGGRHRKFRLDLMVHPDWQRQGIGGELLEHLVAEASRRQAVTIQARVRDDREDALRFLRKRGFVEAQGMHNFGLELNSVDRSILKVAERRVCHQAIRLTTLATLRRAEPDCLQRLHGLYLAVLPDWPDPDPGPLKLPSFEEFLRTLNDLGGARSGFVLAMSGEHILGFSNGLGTGVHPAHRGRGIATAMEARGIELAIRRGWECIVTSTASPAMRAVYEKLGFKRRFIEIRLIRRISGDGSSPR